MFAKSKLCSIFGSSNDNMMSNCRIFYIYSIFSLGNRDSPHYMRHGPLSALSARSYRCAFSADDEDTMLLDPIGPHRRNAAPCWQWHLKSQCLLLKELNPDIGPISSMVKTASFLQAFSMAASGESSYSATINVNHLNLSYMSEELKIISSKFQILLQIAANYSAIMC